MKICLTVLKKLWQMDRPRLIVLFLAFSKNGM